MWNNYIFTKCLYKIKFLSYLKIDNVRKVKEFLVKREKLIIINVLVI